MGRRAFWVERKAYVNTVRPTNLGSSDPIQCATMISWVKAKGDRGQILWGLLGGLKSWISF